MEQKRKICVVTGANTGIGYETALNLGIAGWEVVLACRSFAKGNDAVMAMNNLLRSLDPAGRGAGGGRAVFMELDLASFASIENFISGFKKRYTSCDLLVCNAGIMAVPHTFTEDGYERQFQVNYLGHVLLFNLLLPYLRASGNPRIINISSRAHERARLEQGDFLKAAKRPKESYKPWAAYAQSKLFQIMFTRKAQERYGGEGFLFYAVHPGLVYTNLLRSPLPPLAALLLTPLAGVGLLSGLLLKPRKGAETPTHLALSAEPPGEGGTYWAEKAVRLPSAPALNRELLEEVWSETQKTLENSGKTL